MCNICRKIGELDVFSPPKDYTASVLKILCTELGYHFGTIIKVEKEDRGVMFASHNLPKHYMDEVNRKAPVLLSPAGEAIRSGQIVVVPESSLEPRLSPWREFTQSQNFKTVVWIPLLSRGKGIGTLVLYDVKVREVPKSELQLLQQISVILSIALASNQYLEQLKEQTEELYKEISERKQAELALKKREQEYKSLIENLPNFICRFDQEMRYMYANPAGEKVIGRPLKDIIGKTPQELGVPSWISSVWNENIQSVLATAEEKSLDFEYPTEKGVKYYQSRLIPEFGGDNLPQSVMFVKNDVTDYNRAKEEQAKASKLESIGILAGGIAHDFNNILTVILGNISLAKMNISSEDRIFKRLTESEKACFQAKNLTQQLLTFSKGGAPVKKTCVISDLLKESTMFALRGSNVRCKFEIADNLFPVEVDVGQINQVISNLVINAKQAMPEGGTIRIKAKNATLLELGSEGQSCVKISLEDEGAGILPEHLSKIFDPYFTTKQTGTGLGLTTAYSIIKKHSGQITVDSKLEMGTSFHIYLPVSSKEVDLKEKRKEKIFSGKGRILVMDDEKAIREVAQQMLIKIGYEVNLASDGLEAIAAYRKARELERSFDAVIMDLTIPGGIGGKETLKQLIQIDPGVRAIVSSGYSNDPVLASFKQYGFTGVLRKPYEIQELSKVLDEVIC